MTTDTGEAQRGLRIHRLRAENVLRLEVVEIIPEEHAVIIGGNNGAGKSSVLNAIAMAIGGGKQVPEKVLRDGAKRGKVVLDVGPFRLTRSWTKDDNGRLKIEAKEGQEAPSAQGLLDKLYDAIAFDPFGWARLGDTKTGQKKQREDLLKVAKVDLDLDGNLRDRKARFDERTLVGRDRDRLKGAVESRPLVDAPKEKVDVAELIEKFQKAVAARAEHANAVREVARRRSDLDQLLERGRAEVEALEAEALAAEERLAAWEEEVKRERVRRQATIDAAKRAIPEAQEKHTKQVIDWEKGVEEAAAEADKLAGFPDPQELSDQLSKAKDVNLRVDEAKERRDLEAALENAESAYAELTEQIQALDDQRVEALKTARLPVEGLGFDEDGVTFNKMPFAQLAQSERLRISIAMAMALNKPENGGPGLNVMLCRDGALFDDEHLALVCKMARDRDYQLWIETVGEDEKCSIVMEEGKVKGASPGE